MPRVGAAAHGEGLFVFAGHLVVGVDQRLDGRVVGADVKGLPPAGLFHRACATQGLFQPLGDLGAGDAGGEPAVKVLPDPPVLHPDHPADDGQRVKDLVGGGNAHPAAVGGVVEFLQHRQKLVFLGGAKAVFQQIVHQQADGVHRAGGHGRVAALAPAADAHRPGLRLEGDTLLLGQRFDVRLHKAAGPVGDDVVGHPALKAQDVPRQRPADKAAVEAALLAVAHRELGVRRKAEGRGLVVGQIVFHIPHAGLLVGAQQRPDGVFQGDVLLL